MQTIKASPRLFDNLGALHDPRCQPAPEPPACSACHMQRDRRAHAVRGRNYAVSKRIPRLRSYSYLHFQFASALHGYLVVQDVIHFHTWFDKGVYIFLPPRSKRVAALQSLYSLFGSTLMLVNSPNLLVARSFMKVDKPLASSIRSVQPPQQRSVISIAILHLRAVA
jgi:hypothetical protein